MCHDVALAKLPVVHALEEAFVLQGGVTRILTFGHGAVAVDGKVHACFRVELLRPFVGSGAEGVLEHIGNPQHGAGNLEIDRAETFHLETPRAAVSIFLFVVRRVGAVEDAHAEIAYLDGRHFAFLQLEHQYATRATVVAGSSQHNPPTRSAPLHARHDGDAVVAQLGYFEKSAQGERVEFGVAVGVDSSASAARNAFNEGGAEVCAAAEGGLAACEEVPAHRNGRAKVCPLLELLTRREGMTSLNGISLLLVYEVKLRTGSREDVGVRRGNLRSLCNDVDVLTASRRRTSRALIGLSAHREAVNLLLQPLGAALEGRLSDDVSRRVVRYVKLYLIPDDAALAALGEAGFVLERDGLPHGIVGVFAR